MPASIAQPDYESYGWEKAIDNALHHRSAMDALNHVLDEMFPQEWMDDNKIWMPTKRIVDETRVKIAAKIFNYQRLASEVRKNEAMHVIRLQLQCTKHTAYTTHV